LAVGTYTFIHHDAPPPAIQELLNPWERLVPTNATIIIHGSKEDALNAWNSRDHHLEETLIFTDGSKSDEGCGAGWYVELDPPIEDGVQLPSTATIFQAEAMAIIHALQLANDHHFKCLTIATDSLSCLMALQSSTSKIQHETHLMRKAIQQYCQNNDHHITLQWIPGHHGINGNEKADTIAKNASTGAYRTISIPTSIAIFKQQHLQKITTKWASEYEQCRSRSHVAEQLPTRSQINTIYSDLTLRQSSIIAQYRSGHTDLNSTKMRFYPPTHPKHQSQCRCCGASVETREHVLFDCPTLDDLRKDLHQSMIEHLGAPTYSIQIILDNPMIIKSVAEFLSGALARRQRSDDETPSIQKRILNLIKK
jgi:ribonuclease HI